MTDLDLIADVFVAGGGPAAAWAALKAAEAGADVIVADKGYLGTSGATAAAGTGVWYVQPDPAAREEAMASREGLGGYLADRGWMARVLDQTYANMNELATLARYPFPVGEDGRQIRRGLQGPEYMRRMRLRVRRAGVRILDHSPVTELLVDGDGAVAGAAGHRRQHDQPYRVRAGAVVLATGGCAFLSKALGCDVTPETERCTRPRPARRCRAWSSPTPTPSRRSSPRSPRRPSTPSPPSTTRTGQSFRARGRTAGRSSRGPC
ncbi:FAD-binding protein [Planotetraspora sp. A-T 1434]|uniref:FAD-binding protein n=1 Tax=Planotetraspora sp. A-T 1434 TaxID=2979219 RepID=UPI0021BE0B50|nr:FAD-binding protein [Planotetraspora sp. A-T 1434]MCT9930026.1 FAD-binding protein [Planotetraspora sp. A-T 1434]